MLPFSLSHLYPPLPLPLEMSDMADQPPLKPTWVAATIRTDHSALVSWSGREWIITDLTGIGATPLARTVILACFAGLNPANPINYLVNIYYMGVASYVAHAVSLCWDDFGAFNLFQLIDLPLPVQPDFNATVFRPLVCLETGAVEAAGDWLDRLKQVGSRWADSTILSPVWYNLSQAYVLDARGQFKRLQPLPIRSYDVV
jgi:hypothetical protein